MQAQDFMFIRIDRILSLPGLTLSDLKQRFIPQSKSFQLPRMVDWKIPQLC
jgi:hypothetical protein